MIKKVIVLALSIGLINFLGCEKENSPSVTGGFLFLPYKIALDRSITEVKGEYVQVSSPADLPRFYLRAIEHSYFYLILKFPDDGVTLLFPGAAFPADYYEQEYFLPENRETLFSSPGTYTIYLLAAREPLKEIESLFGDNMNRTKSALILAEIQRIQRETEWVQNLDQKPELMGGTIRGEQNLFNYARPVILENSFVYTMEINYNP